MALETGTATSASDLYSKLISFLTTNADLVAAGQEWVTVWDTPAATENQTDIVLRGPGLSGQDQVYIGMRLVEDPIGDSYYIRMVGMTGVLPNGQRYDDHINVSPSYVRTFLDVGAMQYWFTANGRRFMSAIKISTTFHTMYGGLFLPYATPLAYPYPLFIGGSAGSYSEYGPQSWRSENDNHSHFADPHGDPFNSARPIGSSALMLLPDGEWNHVTNSGNVSDVGVSIGPEYTAGDYLHSHNDGYGNAFIMYNLMDAYGGDRILIPCTLNRHAPVSQTYGILDGAFRCQGVANAAENLITVDGVDHLVLQNVFRSDFLDYWAMALEA